MKKKSIWSVVIALMAILLTACGGKATSTLDPIVDNWSQYKEEKQITIGFDNTFVPMGFKDKSGNNVGFDIDLATAVFDKYGIKVEWQSINWDLKETELTNGNIDLIWNGYSASEERQKKVLFTDSYMKNEQVLVTKKSSNITSPKDMKNKTLGAQAGSSGYEAFSRQSAILKDLVTNKEASQYETFNEALIDLQNDRIDALLIDRVYAQYYLIEEGILEDYHIFSAGFESESFAVGARKVDITLVQKINQAFHELYQEGKFQEISTKWFGEDVAEDVATEQIKSTP